MAAWTEIKEQVTPPAPVQRWGSLVFFTLAVVFIVPQWIYLVGDLRAVIGPFAYALADFLYGPACAACLVLALVILRERIGAHAPNRMSLALLAAALAAVMFVAAAFLRSTNRQYLLLHPELSDAQSTMFLTTWGTIVTAVIATGWHCLGWALLLVGSAGWGSRRLPRGLSGLYLLAGAAALFVYVLPDVAAVAVLLGVALSIWQGIVLWRAAPDEAPAPEIPVL